METSQTTEGDGDSGGATAGDSNLLPFHSTRLNSATDNSSHITVYKTAVQRRLLVLSVLIILCQIVQLICEVCLIMQSKRLSVSTVSAVLVIWTVLSLTLTAQWVILLGTNRIAIVKKGKMIVCGCIGLSILSLLASVVLLLVQNETDKWKDDNIKWLVSTIVTCNTINVIKFFILFGFVIRGQKTVHQVIGSWLWLAIQQHIQRQQALIEEGGNGLIKQHLQATYDANQVPFAAGAA